MGALGGFVLENEPDLAAVGVAQDAGVRADPRLEAGDPTRKG
jgi:hypothetical protein